MLLMHPSATHVMALGLGYTAGSSQKGSAMRSVVQLLVDSSPNLMHKPSATPTPGLSEG